VPNNRNLDDGREQRPGPRYELTRTFGPPQRLDAPDQAVTDLLAAVRLRLRMDVTWLARAAGDRVVVEAIDGDGGSFGVAPGATIRAAASYYRRVVAGEPPVIIRDVRGHGDTFALPATADLRAGAYAVAPVFERDGTFYGVLAALAHEPRPDLQERDGRFLRLAAEAVTDAVSDLRRGWQRRRAFWDKVSAVIDDGGPAMVFQPIVDLAANRIVGVEGLARFPGPADELAVDGARTVTAAVAQEPAVAAGAPVAAEQVARAHPCPHADSGDPERWFAGAAAIGLGLDLELAAVRVALAELPRLPAEVFMSVNVSPASVGPELAQLIRTVDPRRILLEITEHSQIESGSAALQPLDELRAGGVRIGIDDVGTGYSSLSRLLALRPDLLKIDRYLTHGIDTDPARRAITNALLQVAGEIRAVVLAEGIESAAEAATLREIGVRLGQGNHIALPATLPKVPPADFWEIWDAAGSAGGRGCGQPAIRRPRRGSRRPGPSAAQDRAPRR
jgi:EAL domain-containing protein (putative c-di-GMP-specific phosphodiesterase class I)